VDGADPLRVLHLTDPHLFADPEADLRGTVTYRSLTRVLDHYRGSGWQADLVLATGDIIQDDSAEAYRHFRELVGALGLPVYCVPGNHDVQGLMREALAEPPFHCCENVEARGWLIVSVDSCVAGEVHGRVGDAELMRLATVIEQSPADHVLVCLHHPPALMHSRWLDSVGLENREQFLAAVAASSKVRLVLFGHVHQDYEGAYAEFRILGTPSTCRQFAPRSMLFAVDDNPPAYRRLNLYTDGRFEHELIWVNDEPV
jgi:Icc protein